MLDDTGKNLSPTKIFQQALELHLELPI